MHRARSVRERCATFTCTLGGVCVAACGRSVTHAGHDSVQAWKGIGTQMIRRGNRLVTIWTRDGTTAVRPVKMGGTLSARAESESGTESQHVAAYVGRRQSSGEKGRVLSVLIDRDRRLVWPCFEACPPLVDTKKAGQSKREPTTLVTVCHVVIQRQGVRSDCFNSSRCQKFGALGCGTLPAMKIGKRKTTLCPAVPSALVPR